MLIGEDRDLELVAKDADNYKDIIDWAIGEREDKKYYLGSAAMSLKGFAAEALLQKGRKAAGLKLIKDFINIAEDAGNAP